MSSYGPTGSWGDIPKPRRPSPQDVSYLESLPLLAPAASASSSSDDSSSTPAPSPAILSSRAALSSLASSLASTATDETGSTLLERVISLACSVSSPSSDEDKSDCLDSLKVAFDGLADYSLFLAINRYSSHVLQAALAAAGPLLEYEQQSSSSSSSDDTLASKVLQLHGTLSEHMYELSSHVSASHVLRSLLTCLAGLKPESRSSKSEKKGASPDARDSHAVVPSKPSFAVPASFCAALSQAVDRLHVGAGQEDLQTLACGPSSGAVMCHALVCLAVRDAADEEDEGDVVDDDDKSSKAAAAATAASTVANEDPNRAFRLGIVDPGAKYRMDGPAFALVAAVLGLPPSSSRSSSTSSSSSSSSSFPFPDPQVSKASHAAASEVFFTLSTHGTGSIFAECILMHSPPPVFSQIVSLAFHPSLSSFPLSSYVSHAVGNYVVQRLLATCGSGPLATSLLKSLAPLLADGSLLSPAQKRRGVLARTLEAGARNPSSQEVLYNALESGFQKLGVPLDDAAPFLLSMQSGDTSKDGNRLSLDVSGARAFFHLSRFAVVWASKAMKGPLALLAEHRGGVRAGVDKAVDKAEAFKQGVRLACRDGVGKAVVIEALVCPSGAAGVSPNQEESVKRVKLAKEGLDALLRTLRGTLVDLACHHVGHFCVERAFELAMKGDKMEIASELAAGRSRLNGCKPGKAVMAVCCIDDFLEGEEKWRAAVNKREREREKKGELEKDLEKMEGAAKGGGGGGNGGGGAEDGAKKKRKRKRAEKKSSAGDDDDENDDDEEKGKDNKKGEKLPATSRKADDIFAMLTGKSSGKAAAAAEKEKEAAEEKPSKKEKKDKKEKKVK